MTWFGLGIGVLVTLLLAGLSRANEIFVIAVRDGRSLVMRGRVPAALREELSEVVARAHVARAYLRVVRHDGKARLIASGLDDHVAQRLRNVLGLYPDHKLRVAPAPAARNLGQRLGLPWLAFRLAPGERRRR